MSPTLQCHLYHNQGQKINKNKTPFPPKNKPLKDGWMDGWTKRQEANTLGRSRCCQK